ncbi:MBL fold metallo-hydrolase [Aquincola sp. S2]|uniref:MBL fold metallo-hydrolase n=1 Tax=Pseudaquabacterium terrae TaxID=2732868 RepID=A0ABX2EC85_9BURK|nr:MBL fold metallo-hydrolase [Aquabacterium terrae]NRF66176.1 MBL fold metallo-hydrolase [Aquabacterium terrae]
MNAPVTPRAAASLIVLRDAPRGMEVLMLRRADKPGDQNSGAAVFPGGLLDSGDADAYGLCDGLDDAEASRRLGLPANGLNYWIAAVRECFEEAGLLFASGADGQPIALDAQDADALMALRQDLHGNRCGMAELCQRLGVRIHLAPLTYHSHWMTPQGMPKVFDTRFFITTAPPAQTARHDAHETVELLWLTPAEALDAARGLKLVNVTRVTLQALARFSSAAAAIDAARAETHKPLIRPRLGLTPEGKRPVMPGAWAFAEIGRLDAEGRGDVSTELAPGVPVWLSPRILRVTAPNGSMMTGPGTNSYFLGTPGADDWALLDGGPDDAEHVRALIAAAPGRVTRLLATHTHKDHSPAIAALQAHFGAPRFGRVAAYPEWQDPSFQPEHVLSDGDRLQLGPDTTLRVIHTPGHASNHLCYLLEQEKLLFTGDHIMQGSTVVINPPDGDMAVYLASLRRLLDEDLEWLAPGHGFLIDEPHAAVRKLIAHRLQREAKVLDALRAIGPAGEEALRDAVYADTPKHLHGVALRSLRAHLLKLQGDGAATVEVGGVWRLS